jgi:hypothetical protein
LRPLLVVACAALQVACGAVCRGCNRVAADRLGAGRVRTYGAGGRIGGLCCSRPADNQIGAAGAEALARALPPSLTALYLGSTCGWGLVLRRLLVVACAALRVACGAVCRGCNRVAADRLGWGRVRTYGAGGRIGGVWCSRLADNQIGDAGAEALARALPPSLTVLALSSTCGWGLYCGRCLVVACAVLRVACGAVCRGCNRVAADRLGAGECSRMVRGVVLEGVVLAACREPNRRCGRGGAGARTTAAESDGAPSPRYVRLGLVLRPLLVVACAALGCGSHVERCAELATGWRRIGSEGASAHVWCGG